jgi:hypothetical protein
MSGVKVLQFSLVFLSISYGHEEELVEALRYKPKGRGFSS